MLLDNEFTANVALPDVAIKLRELRLTKGLSLVAVAKACKIKLNDLSAWEIGKAEPSKEILERLVGFYSQILG